MTSYENYTNFWITCDDGYTTLTYTTSNSDEHGEVVCDINAGDSLAGLIVKADRCLAGRV